MKPATHVVHQGIEPDRQTGAVILPINLSTTFERDPDGEYSRGYYYSRPDNPTRGVLERCLAELEGGQVGACFSSGSAASMAVFQSLDPGDHVIAPLEAYHGTIKMLRTIGARWGLTHTQVNTTDTSAVERAMTEKTKLIWLETPSNPRLQISDIAAIAEIAWANGAKHAGRIGSHGVLLVCDNTLATPLLQSPLSLGAGAVMHSTTKYLSGHGDVLGGALVFADEKSELAQRVRDVQVQVGAVPSPFDCWLALRGIKTLALRVRAHCDNAARVAAFFDKHPRVEAVHYPGLPGHPGHELATRQMRGFGGLLSFEVPGGQAGAMAMIARLGLIRRATSLGGVESLIEHRASMEAQPSMTPDNLIRLSVGIEDPDDLIADLDQALR
ncbi:MAG: aminotransferase class I/II-fold pyridoxal phosphate-dependent enzyme [Planctomycetes bacterium]|nr:aminotransferase class I/II-fold pyridoxal phosphate-dependent enzyme [Planctomycetota bacterium]